MKPIDDYNLIEDDFEEFMRRGRESFGIEEEKPHESHGEQARH